MRLNNNLQNNNVADCYHEFVISPLRKGVKNPLFNSIKKINSEELTAADLGTGRGDLIPFLSERFKKVYALDFSKNMLKIAKKKSAKNVILKQADLRKLQSIKDKIDVAISVNSILLPDSEDVDNIIGQIYSSLKDKGYFFAVVPSMEAIAYNSMLIYEREYDKYKNEKKALARARKIAERKKYCFIRGIYDDGERQKLFYRFEIIYRLSSAGFKKINIKKVFYPWDNQGDFEKFENKPKMWDWFVSARK